MPRTHSHTKQGLLLSVLSPLAAHFCVIGASAQCTPQWLPGDPPPGVVGETGSMLVFDFGDGPKLVVGGSFFAAGSNAVNGVAVWDGAEWNGLGEGLGTVNTLHAHNGELFAGGSFALTRDDKTSRVARWDGSHWQPFGTMAHDAPVSTLATYQGRLLCAGSFTAVDGAPAAAIAGWDGSRWSEFAGGANDEVLMLLPRADHLIVGGAFTTVGSVAANRIASWDGVKWRPLGLGVGIANGDAAWTAIEFHDELVVGGRFTRAGDGFVQHIAAWNGTSWRELSGGPNSSVHTLLRYQGNLVVGGSFTAVSGLPIRRLATWDGSAWQSFGTGVVHPSEVVCEFQDNLYCGTAQVRGAASAPVSRWSGASWIPLGEGTEGDIFAMAPMSDGSLVVGGGFSQLGSVECDRVARRVNGDWIAMGSGLGGTVKAVVEAAGTIYAGGTTTSPPGIARWDGTAWQDVAGGIDGECNALAAFDGGVVVAGAFTRAGMFAASHIAFFDGQEWRQMGAGFNRRVRALAVHEGRLYAGGDFSLSGQTGIQRVAVWNGKGWESCGFDTNREVYSLASSPVGLIAGGSFEPYGSLFAFRIARLSPTGWTHMNIGLPYTVRSIAVVNGQIYAVNERRDLPGSTRSTIYLLEQYGWSVSGDVYGYRTCALNSMVGVGSSLYIGGAFERTTGGVSTGFAEMKCLCPTDFDGDGFVTGADLDLFVQAFETGETAADFDHDGFLTGADFDLFVQAFERGC